MYSPSCLPFHHQGIIFKELNSVQRYICFIKKTNIFILFVGQVRLELTCLLRHNILSVTGLPIPPQAEVFVLLTGLEPVPPKRDLILRQACLPFHHKSNLSAR